MCFLHGLLSSNARLLSDEPRQESDPNKKSIARQGALLAAQHCVSDTDGYSDDVCQRQQSRGTGTGPGIHCDRRRIPVLCHQFMEAHGALIAAL